MCWKAITGKQRPGTKVTTVNCEICKAIATLGLESSAHDLWACADEERTGHNPRRRFMAREFRVSIVRRCRAQLQRIQHRDAMPGRSGILKLKT